MSDSPLTDSEMDLVQQDVKRIGDETKKTFKLGDYTKKITSRRERVLVYLDLEALDEWLALGAEQEQLSGRISSLTKIVEQKRRAELQAQYDEAEKREEELHVQALQSAISLHLQALPDIAIKVLKKQARKGYEDDNGNIPAEFAEEVNDLFDRLVLARQVTQIVNSEGAVADDVDEDTVQELIENTSPSQRQRVLTVSKTIQYTDQIGRALIDGDPGF